MKRVEDEVEVEAAPAVEGPAVGWVMVCGGGSGGSGRIGSVMTDSTMRLRRADAFGRGLSGSDMVGDVGGGRKEREREERKNLSVISTIV